MNRKVEKGTREEKNYGPGNQLSLYTISPGSALLMKA